MRITDYPDLLRTKGKEPMPQAWDETNQDWTPAIDSAATLTQIKTALTDGTQKVALTGNLIETAQAMPVVPKSATTATILTRGIRRSTTSTAAVTVPDNVVGAVIWCEVYGVTGTFDANQGLALSLSWRTPNKCKISDTQSTSRLATAGARAVVFGTALDPLNIATTGALIPIGARPFGNIVAIISISGTFATEEGFDCEVFVQWLY